MLGPIPLAKPRTPSSRPTHSGARRRFNTQAWLEQTKDMPQFLIKKRKNKTKQLQKAPELSNVKSLRFQQPLPTCCRFSQPMHTFVSSVCPLACLSLCGSEDVPMLPTDSTGLDTLKDERKLHPFLSPPSNFRMASSFLFVFKKNFQLSAFIPILNIYVNKVTCTITVPKHDVRFSRLLPHLTGC